MKTHLSPQLLKGPKYSNNLRLWLKKHMRTSKGLPLVYAQEGTGRLFIRLDEYERDWLGAFMGRIITQGSSTCTSYMPVSKLGTLTLVPYFWEAYADKGICTIDPEHSFYSERWNYSDTPDHRTCSHCGLQQRKYTWEETVVQSHSKWA